jgi:hypothetical protein
MQLRFCNGKVKDWLTIGIPAGADVAFQVDAGGPISVTLCLKVVTVPSRWYSSWNIAIL